MARLQALFLDAVKPMAFILEEGEEAKEREEQLRCLDKASNRGKSQYFHNRCPQAPRHRGGAHTSRQGSSYGYGRGCFHPYHHKFGTHTNHGRGKRKLPKGSAEELAKERAV